MIYSFIFLLFIPIVFSKSIGQYIISLIILRPIIVFFTGIAFAEEGQFRFSPGSLWALYYIIICLIFLLINNKRIDFQKPIIKTAILLIFFLIPSILLSEYTNTMYAIGNYSKYLTWLLSVLVFDIITNNRNNIMKILQGLNIVSYIVILTYFASIILNKIGVISIEASAYSYNRVEAEYGYSGLFNSPQGAGFLFFVLHGFHVLYKKIKTPGFNGITINDVLTYAGMFLTFSRSVWLLLLVYIIIKYTRKGQYLKISVALTSIVLILFLLSPSLKEGFFYRAIGEGDRGNEVILNQDYDDFDAVGSGRIGMWRGVLYSVSQFSFKEYMFGYGFGYDFVATAPVTGGRKSHNDFLSILLENGVINLFLFIIFLTLLNRKKSFRVSLKRDYSAVFWAVFSFIIFQGITTFPEFLFVIILYLLSYKLSTLPKVIE